MFSGPKIDDDLCGIVEKTGKIDLNPCPAELFQSYFSSFEAGIANAISSFK